jgi:hypothetical protein
MATILLPLIVMLILYKFVEYVEAIVVITESIPESTTYIADLVSWLIVVFDNEEEGNYEQGKNQLKI